jgi:cytochrome P450
VASILDDPATFSSAVPKFGKPLIPIEVDPPEHAKFRKLLDQMMSPRRMVGYETAVRADIVEAIDSLVAQGGGNIVDLTYRLPIRTFCLLMGENDPSFDDLDRARREGSPSPQQVDAEAAARRKALMEPLREFCRKRLRACRAQPEDNLASDIAHAQIDGRPLDEEEALSILSLIYIAGHGTTTAGMQSAILQLAQHDEAQRQLRETPRMIPAAIEECLRLETPLHTLPRYCARDTSIAGSRIRAGDQGYPVYGAANVDPDLFPDPARFDIDRRPSHFAFGRGIHRCAGAALARMQIRVLVEELLTRTARFSLATPRVRKPWPQNACTTLVLEFEPA